jgi:hypothetical protein
MMTASVLEVGSILFEVDAFMRVVGAFVRFMNTPMPLVVASKPVMNVSMSVIDSGFRVG